MCNWDGLGRLSICGLLLCFTNPSRSAEDGGPGFTGEGWTTVADPKPQGDPRAVKGGAISYGIREFPGNIRMYGTGHNTWLNYAVNDLSYMGLMKLDPNTLEFLPALASHWQISEDKMTYRFRINPDAKWSDGTPVTTDDVLATYKLIMDDTLLDPSAKQTYGKLEAPKALSKYIIEVKAKEVNWRNFLYFGASLTILPAKEIANLTGKDYLDKYNYQLTAVTGPYEVKKEDIDQKTKTITLTRRENWWGKDRKENQGLYNFNKIRFIEVIDPELAFQKACKGELDYFWVQKAEWWVKDLPEQSAVKNGWLVRQKFFNDAPNGTAGYALNMRHPPLDDVRVRQALQLLLDRKTMIEKLAYNEYTPQSSYYAGSEYENPSNEKMGFDQARAVQLLADAGWKTRGADGVLTKDGKRLSMKFTYYSKALEKFITTYQQDCKAVGVEFILDFTQPETMWKNLMERKFEVCSMQWGGLVFPNPETSDLSTLADKNDNNNICGIKIPAVDELCKKYDLAFTQEERRQIVREIDGLVYKEHPYVLSWYQPCQRVMYWNKFGMPDYGLRRTAEYEDVFQLWWVDPEKDKALRAAKVKNTPLPKPASLENHYWHQTKTSAAK